MCWLKRKLTRLLPARRSFTVLAIFALGLAQAAAETRVALVVGNGRYADQPQLPNPAHDAQDMAAALEDLGFKVITGIDLTKAEFDGKLHEFSRSSTGADVAFFFYSGHGMQINGINYLVPTDAPLTKEDLDFQTVTLDFVQNILERAKTKIIMLDACRSNPFAAALGASLGTRAIGANSGLAVATAPDLGFFIAFATQPGHVASDGAGRNSPFTGALKTHLPTPGLSVSDLMILVRNDVAQATNGEQIPWDHSALASRFYFKEGDATVPGDEGRKSSDAAEVWGWVRDTSNPATLQQFISLYGDSPYAPDARTRLASLSKVNSPVRPVSLPRESGPIGSSKPSFDCRAQHSEAEVTICNKPELSLLDNELSRLYSQALKTFKEATRKTLTTEQRVWSKSKNDCGTDAACLANQYSSRIAKLKSMLTATALPVPQVSPSFDCSNRTQPAEVAVCSHPDLAELDLEVDKLYTAKLKGGPRAAPRALVAAQREWVRNRDTCSSSLPCLKIQYAARIKQLQGQAASE